MFAERAEVVFFIISPGRTAGASLKHPSGNHPGIGAVDLPRQKRRGLIEARKAAPAAHPYAQIFPGRNAGASLKPLRGALQ